MNAWQKKEEDGYVVPSRKGDQIDRKNIEEAPTPAAENSVFLPR
jgi:hypothetical protein